MPAALVGSFEVWTLWTRSSRVASEKTVRSIETKFSEDVVLILKKLRCDFQRAVRGRSASARVSFEIANGRRTGVPG